MGLPLPLLPRTSGPTPGVYPFAGREVARAFALLSTELADCTDNLEGLAAIELDNLKEWEDKFNWKVRGQPRVCAVSRACARRQPPPSRSLLAPPPNLLSSRLWAVMLRPGTLQCWGPPSVEAHKPL
jgi:hypothetical protein